MSTFALQSLSTALPGLDLSPYFLAVADYRLSSVMLKSTVHAAAESTGLPAGSFDLVSTSDVPRIVGNAADFTLCATFAASGWIFMIMDESPVGGLCQDATLHFDVTKSTEPYLDEYFVGH